MAANARPSYLVYSGRRPVAEKKAWSGSEAVKEYLAALGVTAAEVSVLGPNSVTWRGATFKAVRVNPEPTPSL
jgi:hypothetical protein